MKKIILVLFVLHLAFVISYAQDNEEKKFGISFKGFVKNDVMYDTRQTVSVREGHFLLYPAAEKLDPAGKDINAKSNFNMLSIQSRLTGAITGPDAFGAKTSGVLEGAFFGHTDGDINGFRLRHAYLVLDWEKDQLLFGQTWNAMFIPECFPDVVSFNTGAPFQPFARNPQIRYTRKMNKLKLIATMMSQRDFTSPGGSASLRNAVIPDMNLKLQYQNKNGDNELVAGTGAAYKTLVPRLSNAAGYQVHDEKVSGLSFMAFFKMKSAQITYKLEGVYGQNLFDVTMLGGYAIRYTTDTFMINNDYRDYTAMDVLSVWSELHTNGKKIQFGLFGGYTKNMGSQKNLYDWQNTASYFVRGGNIDYVYRISPRVVFNSGKTRFALETEYTVAAYGNVSNNNSLGAVQDAEEVSNLRLLLGAYYFF
jgi:hypothetical protein